MSEKPSQNVAVVMQRRASQSRWVDHVWEPIGVLGGHDERRAALAGRPGRASKQWLHPGFELVLHKDEIEGYYLNVSASEPRVFVLWRMEARERACRST